MNLCKKFLLEKVQERVYQTKLKKRKLKIWVKKIMIRSVKIEGQYSE
jgi:hypothetical protein